MIDQHKSLAEKFIKKGFWLYLFSFIIAPIAYIIKIIVSWNISVEELGILYGIISLITLLAWYNDLWMSESLKYFIPKYTTEKKYDKVKSILLFALCIQIVTSILIASFFYFGADYIANNYFKSNDAKETLKIFAFFFLGLNFFQTISHFFLSVQDTFYNKFSDFLRILFILFCVLYVYFFETSSLINYSYSWLIWLYIWLIFAIIIFYKKYYKKYFYKSKISFDKETLGPLVKYASFVFIWASAGTLLSQVDMQMIIYLLGTKDAGYYTNYLSIIWIPFLLIWPIFGFLFPVFSELHAKWDIEKIKLLKNVFQNNFLVIWIAFNIFFFVFAEILAYIFFGLKFIESWVIMKYSILFLVFNYLFQINLNIMIGTWKVYNRMKIIFIALIFNIIMNIILISYIWVYGAALATGLWWMLIWGLSEYFLWREYSIHLKYNNIIKNIVILWSIAILSEIYLLSIFDNTTRVSSLWLLLITAIIYGILFLIINKYELKWVISEIKKIKTQD